MLKIDNTNYKGKAFKRTTFLYQYSFTNTYPFDIRLSLKASCSCVTPTYTKDKKGSMPGTIKSGSKGLIVGSLNTSSSISTKTITVTVNDANNIELEKIKLTSNITLS